MDDQATVTLTSIEAPPHCPLATRTIKLKHNQAVPVGRASKVESKGYIARADNAWFDSAVMSRNHAELSADLAAKSITVTDPGSLHGTYVNNDRVAKDVPHVLHNGDTVVFGMSIYRRNEEFPPTRIRVNFELPAKVPEEQPRVFCPPESVDASSDEDEDEDGCSVQEVEPMGRHGASRSYMEVARANAVDLTGDDENDPQDQVVDLTDSPKALRPTSGNHTVFDDLNLDLESASELESNLFSDVLSSDWGSEDGENGNEMDDLSSNPDANSSDDGDDDDNREIDYDAYDSDEDDVMADDHLSYVVDPEVTLPGDIDNNIWDEADSDHDIPDNVDDFGPTVAQGGTVSTRPLLRVPPLPQETSGQLPSFSSGHSISSPQDGTKYSACPIPALLNPAATAKSNPLIDVGTSEQAQQRAVSALQAKFGARATTEENGATTVTSASPDVKGKGKETHSAHPYGFVDESTNAWSASPSVSYPSLPFYPPLECQMPYVTQQPALYTPPPNPYLDFPQHASDSQDKPAVVKAVENQVATPQDGAGSPAVVRDAIVTDLIGNDLLETGQRFLHSPPAIHKSEDEHDSDDDAMLSAATFQQHKIAKTYDRTSLPNTLKRKADAISEEQAVVEPLTPTSEEHHVEEPAAVVGPPAKRPATDSAVAKSKARGMAWAIVEKMGLAALGGAMVFGALVSSAPALP